MPYFGGSQIYTVCLPVRESKVPVFLLGAFTIISAVLDALTTYLNLTEQRNVRTLSTYNIADHGQRGRDARLEYEGPPGYEERPGICIAWPGLALLGVEWPGQAWPGLP